MLGKSFHRNQCISFIESCFKKDGGFSPSVDGEPDVESTRFAIDTLSTLRHRAPVKGITVSFIKRCQTLSVGFSPTCLGAPALASTYYAVMALHTLKMKPRKIKKLVEWIQSLQTSDGGFRSNQESTTPPTIDDTFYAVRVLETFERGPIDPHKCSRYIYACQNIGGGFSNTVRGTPSIESTYCSLRSLRSLNAFIEDKSACESWVLSQSPFAAQCKIPQEELDLPSMYWSLHSLSLLKRKLKEEIKASDMILRCQRPDGGFGGLAMGGQSELWPTYCAVRSLKILKVI